MTRQPRDERGFTLMELVITVAFIALLCSVATVAYAHLTGAARIVKARADIRALATATFDYTTHMGTFPSSLAVLSAAATNAQGRTAGPFLTLPAPPPGWSAYDYSVSDGGFTIAASGDGVTVSGP